MCLWCGCVTALCPQQIQPGLGLSETWYSWIVSIQSTGELVGAILFGLLMRWLYAKHLMLANLAVCASGGLVFGIGKYGWMLLIGEALRCAYLVFVFFLFVFLCFIPTHWLS